MTKIKDEETPYIRPPRHSEPMTQIKTYQILLIGLILIGAFYLFPAFVKVPQSTINVTIPGQPAGQPDQSGFINYQIGFLYTERLSTTGGTVTTTSPSYRVYNSESQRLSSVSSLYGKTPSVIASGTTATGVPITAKDNGYLFIGINPGTTDFPDPAKILKDNPAFTSCKWMPVASSGVNELVCELEISQLGAPNYQAGTNAITTTLKIAVNLDDLAVTMSAPADQDSLGTTASTDVYVTWTLSALASTNAFAFGRIQVTSNQTSAYMTLHDMIITPSASVVNMQTFSSASKLTFNTAASTSGTAAGITQTWKYWPRDKADPNDYSDTLLIARSANDGDTIDVRVHAKVSFPAATDAVTIVLSGTVMSAANALQTAVTDTAILGG